MLQTLSQLEDVQKLYTWFEEKRQNEPVWFDESSGCWHVFRYADVYQILSNYTLFSSERPQRFTPRPNNNQKNPAAGLGRSLIALDPPQHQKYRGLVSAAFTPRAINNLRERIAVIAQELIDGVRAAGRMDLVNDFAYPLPTTVIAEMLGAPVADRPLFQKWADALLSQQLSDAEFFRPRDEEQQERPEMKRIMQAFEEMQDYFNGLLDDRLREPRNDMMSALLSAEVEGQKLNREDTISFCILLLLAGHVTTTNLLSQSIRCFDQFPETLEQMRRQPDLIPGAIEEVLRYASPIWRLIRVTREETVIAGVKLPKEAPIFTWLASANRDPEQFSEPERFDILRSPNKHVGFGHGIHFCIGAPLSRLETAVALPMLIEQMPELRRDPSAPMEIYRGRALFGFKHLPVVFKPSVPVG